MSWSLEPPQDFLDCSGGQNQLQQLFAVLGQLPPSGPMLALLSFTQCIYSSGAQPGLTLGVMCESWRTVQPAPCSADMGLPPVRESTAWAAHGPATASCPAAELLLGAGHRVLPSSKSCGALSMPSTGGAAKGTPQEPEASPQALLSPGAGSCVLVP